MKKRLLVLTPRFPYPPISGGKIGLLNVVKAFEDYDHTLLSLCGTREEMELEPEDGLFAAVHKVYLPKWKSYWNVLASLPGQAPIQLAYYHSQTFRHKVRELLPQHDVVMAHLIRAGQYIADSDQEAPRILFMSDAISLAYQRLARLRGTSLLWRILSRVELNRLFRYEKACPEKFELVWLHSEVDRSFLGLKQNSVKILPLGIDLDQFPLNLARSGDVVAFVGNMSFNLNIDACRHLIRDIYPALTEAGIRLRVIGACPPSVRIELEKHEGVEVTGAVNQIADAMKGVFCGVCPVRAASGIQNKILNYLALGVPCVTSDVGLEGLDAVDGRDLLVYRKPADAVELIFRLHKDSSLRERIATNGRKYVEESHDWKIIHRAIRKDVQELLASKLESTADLASRKKCGPRETNLEAAGESPHEPETRR